MPEWISTSSIGRPAAPGGSPASLLPIDAVSAGGPGTKAQQLWVASGNSARIASMNARAAAALGAWPRLAIKRLRSMDVSVRCSAAGIENPVSPMAEGTTQLYSRAMTIRVFVTGGTFDKDYNELRGTLDFEDTHVPEMLRLGRCELAVAVRTLMMVDSLDMTDNDRATIVDNCRRADESQIVVTHGTDTMVETAQALAAAITDKTIVLTG